MELKIVKPGREFKAGEVWKTREGDILLRLVSDDRGSWVVLKAVGPVWKSGYVLTERADRDVVEFLGYIDG